VGGPDKPRPRRAERGAAIVARLDDPAIYATGDPRGLGRLCRGFPSQLVDAGRLADGVRLPGKPPQAVVLLGMGGSAVAGDLLRALWHERAPCPVEVIRGYTVPAWVGPDTLVVASSYSGETEETLAAFDAARAAGAGALVVTSGGRLGERATREDLPWVRIPPGFPPRAALAYLLVPLVTVLGRVWPALGHADERDEAAEVVESLGVELGPESAAPANPAKALAAWALGRTPVIYGSDATASVAYRWRTQFEENAKVLAASGALPEMNHNAIEAWGAGPGGRWAVVFLRDRGDHPRVARRIELTRAIIEAHAPTREVWSRGRGQLARILSLVSLGDWVSYYVALLRGVDPWTVETLDAFKRRMAEPDRVTSGQDA